LFVFAVVLHEGRSRVGVPASGTGDLFPARIYQELKNSGKDARMRGFHKTIPDFMSSL
jgi:hypothetical protein